MSYKLFCLFLLLGFVLYVQGQYHNLTTSDTYAVVGSPFTFICRGDAFPVITWFVNNAEYSMNRGRRHGHCHVLTERPKAYTFYCSVFINILTIKSVSLSQHGTVLRCGVYMPDSNEVKLEVRDGPGTSLKLNTLSVVTAVEGSDVTVSCSATCFIMCSYQWKVVDDVISNTGILSLANIKISQSGVYVCTAENPDTKQTANRTLHLIVQCPVQDGSQFWIGFSCGFGSCFPLVIIVIIYVRCKRNKQTAKADKQTAEADEHHDSQDNLLDKMNVESERTDVDE